MSPNKLDLFGPVSPNKLDLFRPARANEQNRRNIVKMVKIDGMIFD